MIVIEEAIALEKVLIWDYTNLQQPLQRFPFHGSRSVENEENFQKMIMFKKVNFSALM